MNKELLLKIKSNSKTGLIIGLIISAISAITYFWSDSKLIKLDEGRLDQPFQE